MLDVTRTRNTPSTIVRHDDSIVPRSSFALLLLDDNTTSDRTSDTTKITDVISRSKTGHRMRNGRMDPQEWDRNHGGGCSSNVLSNCVVTAASCETIESIPPSIDDGVDNDAALAAAVAEAAFMMEMILPLILALYPRIPPPRVAAAADAVPPTSPPVNHPIHTTSNEQKNRYLATGSSDATNSK